MKFKVVITESFNALYILVTKQNLFFQDVPQLS